MTSATINYSFLQQYLQERSAIVLQDDKKYLAESRLQPLAKKLGFEDADTLLSKLRTSSDRQLGDQVVEAMTTNETLWFRDLRPFEALKRTILPDLIARKASSRTLAIWSAASSSGQELYSLAMLIADDFPELLNWRLTLRGTDLSDEMVQKAKAGRYSTLEINRGLPASLLVKHFEQSGGHYQLKDSIRRMADFRQLNLIQPWTGLESFDLILVRNVLIYFDLSTRRQILAALHKKLVPQGILMIGSTESLVGVSDAFDMRNANGATYFQRKD